MKTKLLLASLLLFVGVTWAQESFKKKYKICEDTIKFKGGDFIFLKKDSLLKYEDLEKSKIKIGDKFTAITEIETANGKANVSKEIIVDQNFLETLELKHPVNVKLNSSICSFVSFENNKIYINPYLKEDSNGKYSREPIYFYELKNRQSIKLSFSEVNVSALIIPIKYRFKGKNGLEEEFSTAINGNIFIGYSLGKTSFFHQEKVGNKSNTWKFTGGLIFGASTVTLNNSNTSQSVTPLDKDTEIVKGLASTGLGITYTFNKINFGAFYGYDYAIGNNSSLWNYNKKPWLGIAIGYSILSL